jgi:hypothetical protein
VIDCGGDKAFLCRFLGRRKDGLSTRLSDRRPRSAKARNRGGWGNNRAARLMAAVDYFNDDPVVHTWTYKLDKAA